MRAKKATNFCKSNLCPSAEMLLSLLESEFPDPKMKRISNHLVDCEFCCSELYLLANYPPIDDICREPEAMPSALRHLAEALLGDKRTEFRLFSELVRDKESLTLKSI